MAWMGKRWGPQDGFSRLHEPREELQCRAHLPRALRFGGKKNMCLWAALLHEGI